MVQIPNFIKEVIWSFYPPRYRQLSDKPVYKSIGFMTKMLLIAFLLGGLVFVPRLFTLESSVQEQLGVFDELRFTPKVEQRAEFAVPSNKLWIRIDMKNNLALKDELLVVDQSTVQYRLLSPESVSQAELKEPSAYRENAGSFFAMIIALLIPGVTLLLFVRSWLKYLLLVFLFGTFFFIITDLTRYKMKWRQMVSIAAHAISPILILEVVASAITTSFLLPIPAARFLGLKFFVVTLVLYAAMMVMAVIGCRVEDYKTSTKA